MRHYTISSTLYRMSYIYYKDFYFFKIKFFLTSFEIINTYTQFDINLKYQKLIEFFFSFFNTILRNFSLSFI